MYYEFIGGLIEDDEDGLVRAGVSELNLCGKFHFMEYEK
jgi:hypothetical protein